MLVKWRSIRPTDATGFRSCWHKQAIQNLSCVMCTIQYNPYVLYFHVVVLLKLIRKTHEVTEMYSCPNHIHLCVHFFERHICLVNLVYKNTYTTHHILVYFVQKKVSYIFGYTSKFMSSYANQKVVLHLTAPLCRCARSCKNRMASLIQLT